MVQLGPCCGTKTFKNLIYGLSTTHSPSLKQHSQYGEEVFWEERKLEIEVHHWGHKTM